MVRSLEMETAMTTQQTSRRSFLRSTLFGSASAALLRQRADAALKKMKITRVRYYESPITRPIFNQSFHVVTVETDQGITGIGEGGSPDTIRQCAGLLIGEDPTRIEHLWQYMYRAFFDPPVAGMRSPRKRSTRSS